MVAFFLSYRDFLSYHEYWHIYHTYGNPAQLVCNVSVSISLSRSSAFWCNNDIHTQSTKNGCITSNPNRAYPGQKNIVYTVMFKNFKNL